MTAVESGRLVALEEERPLARKRSFDSVDASVDGGRACCGSCCSRPTTRRGKVAWFIAVLFVCWVLGSTVRLATANNGDECEPVSAPISHEEWDATGLPQVDFVDCENPEGDIPLSMLRLVGHHNSYKMRPKPVAMAIGINALIPEFRYEKPVVTEQLESGFRHFEFDVHFGVDKSRVMAFHVPVLDEKTTCYCLADCLVQIREWSDANPAHLPIVVEFEIKSGNIFESMRDALYKPKAPTLLHLDELIRTIWADARARVFTPDDLRRDSGLDSLPAVIEARGWPSVESMRGKVMFGMYRSSGWELSEYTENGKRSALQGRTMFAIDTPADEGPFGDHVAIAVRNDAEETGDDIADLVARGFLVRSRANVVTDAPGEFDERAAATLSAGSQLVTMDVEVSETWADIFGGNGNVGVCSEDLTPRMCNTTVIACPAPETLN